MPGFLSDRFLGVFLEVSDDRTLTNLCLKQGYKAVYQSTSCVYTDAPVGMRKMAKQQLRWARGSQYNTLRMLPWMMRNTPMLALFYVTDIIMPFLLLACASGFVVRMLLGENVNFYDGITYGYGAAVGTTIIVVLTLLATWFSVYIRQARHFEEHPRDLILLPAFTLAEHVHVDADPYLGVHAHGAQRRLGDACQRVPRREGAHHVTRTRGAWCRTCSPPR